MMYGYVKGYPLNALWGFKYGGVWKNQDEVNRNKATFAYASPSTTSNGSVRYYDINHDGTLSQDDLVYLAMPILGFMEVCRTPSVSVI